jgi:outer membrane protein OmpA-like peptidoglycan-associated protein
MIQRSLTITLLMFLTASLYAQEQKSISKLAEEAYAREEYAVAGALYKRQARSKGDKTPVPLLMKMAHSYQEIGYFKDAADIYQRIVSRPDRPSSAYFAYGEALRQLEQYDAARQQYALFITDNADSIKLKTIALQGCDSAAIWLKAPARVQLKSFTTLNTPGSDLVNGVTGKGLLLMSNGYQSLIDREGGAVHPPSDKRTSQPYYKAYVYKQDTEGNTHQFLEELAPALLADYDFHIGPVCLNKAADTLYATINIQGKRVPVTGKLPNNGIRHLQIYQSEKKDGKWQPMVLIPGLNIAGYFSSHAVLNKNGDILYFVSDRPGGYGQSDIWYCTKQADGTWGQPVNCGDKINTVASETFPTVNEEGILYFSSKGYAGLGGYDIYRVKGSKASWEMPENMKAPFNSGADEIGFILNPNSSEGYLASNKGGGMGRDDIYYFNDPAYFNRLNGATQQPTVVNASAPATTAPITTTPRLTEKQHTEAEEAAKGKLEQLKFYYDYNSVKLLPESRRILDEVAETLQQHPDWKMMIVSHSDSRGSDQYNAELSALRSLSAIQYLVDKGIDPKRLYYSNKGEQQPVNGCKDGVPCKEDEYKENRRTEFQVKW